MINEEITQKECNLAARVGSMAYQEIKKAIDKLIADLSQRRGNPTPTKTPEAKHGKMTLKELQKQGDGLATVELKDPHLRTLKSTLKKHGVDFSAVKDGKGKYTLFFKGKDADTVTHALKQYTQKIIKVDKGKGKPSIKNTLDEAKKAAQSLNTGRDKVQKKDRGAR